jgi:hypothetical protein
VAHDDAMAAAVCGVSRVAVASAVAAEVEAAKTLWKRAQIESAEGASAEGASVEGASAVTASEVAASAAAASENAAVSSRILMGCDMDQPVAAVRGVMDSLAQPVRQLKVASARATRCAV